MIVLDEQLHGRGLDVAIARWYRGRICTVTDLRPGSVIKDEAIPVLLHRQSNPTFVTINESDFWRKVPITDQFCVACFVMELSRAAEVAPLLRRLLATPGFKSKAERRGKVARIAPSAAYWYSARDKSVRRLTDW